MVKKLRYSNLIPGRKYKLGEIRVGKFVRKTDNGTLIFLNSDYGEEGENEIDQDEEDEYTEIKTKKSKKRSVKGGKQRTQRRYKKKL